jgi:hypothetical protein
MTKISRLTLEEMATTQEEAIMDEEDTMVEVGTINKVDIKTTLQEGQDVGYAIKKII